MGLNSIVPLATSPTTSDQPGELPALLDRARLRVLRAAVLICLLITLADLAGAVFGFTASGDVTGPAVELGIVWSVVWALAATFPPATAACFIRWRITATVLVVANAATVAVTGGIDSPLLAVCMYSGWIASIVVSPRAALAISALITLSVLAGYLAASPSIDDVFASQFRYGAVANALLPLVTGAVGVLLATVTNGVFSRLESTLDGLRAGAPATTPGLTALLAGTPVLELTPGPDRRHPPARAATALTAAEREVVNLLAAGSTAQQIALLRGVKESTVRSQIKAAKRKTGAKTLAQLARHAS